MLRDNYQISENSIVDTINLGISTPKSNLPLPNNVIFNLGKKVHPKDQSKKDPPHLLPKINHQKIPTKKSRENYSPIHYFKLFEIEKPIIPMQPSLKPGKENAILSLQAKKQDTHQATKQPSTMQSLEATPIQTLHNV